MPTFFHRFFFSLSWKSPDPLKEYEIPCLEVESKDCEEDETIQFEETSTTKPMVQDEAGPQSPTVVKSTTHHQDKDMPTSPLISTKRFFAQAFGLNQRIEEIALRIAEVCFQTKSHNGGVISISKVHEVLNHTRPVELADMPLAVQELKTVGFDFRIIQVGHYEMIVSV